MQIYNFFSGNTSKKAKVYYANAIFLGVSVVDFYRFIEERAENQLLTVNSVNPTTSYNRMQKIQHFVVKIPKSQKKTYFWGI